MEIISSPQEMQALAMIWLGEGLKIVLVPTMGFFHEGHLSLMKHGRGIGDRLVVSLFVNPTQFGPGEDLERYPRDLDRDAALAREVGVNVLFTPEAEQMYPEGFQTYVTVEKLSQGLCGASRPGHFRGVATVVLKLFNLVQPHAAIFGEKDYQQVMVIRRMTRDLNLPIDIISCPIVREPDGLAMSSRNAYLSPEERTAALSLSKALKGAQKLAAAGEKSRDKILDLVRKIISQAPNTRIDYLSLVHPETLEEMDTLQGEARLVLAAWVGDTRLIDNALLPEARYTCCV
jgi:pantoate--beta-alanine ligase